MNITKIDGGLELSYEMSFITEIAHLCGIDKVTDEFGFARMLVRALSYKSSPAQGCYVWQYSFINAINHLLDGACDFFECTDSERIVIPQGMDTADISFTEERLIILVPISLLCNMFKQSLIEHGEEIITCDNDKFINALIVALKQTSEVHGLTTLPRGCESIYIAISCMIGQVVKESDTNISMDDFRKLSCSLVTDNFIFYRNKEECDDMRLYDRDMALFKKGSFVSTEFMLELERIVRKEGQVYYMDSETLYTLQYFLA